MVFSQKIIKKSEHKLQLKNVLSFAIDVFIGSYFLKTVV